MDRTIQCATLSKNKVKDYNSIEDLLEVAGEEVFLIDMDAIKKGKPSFDFYQELSKFIDVYVLSLVNRVDDLVDTIILGCAGVVISPTLDSRKLREFLDISENVIMPYTSLPTTREFSRLGGKYYLSNTLVSFNFTNTFFYGSGDPGKSYIHLKDFPLEYQNLALE